MRLARSGKCPPRAAARPSARATQDRDKPGRYFNIVFFDSYEEAMENSALPETDRLSKKLMGFANGPPTFYNLDVVDDQD